MNPILTKPVILCAAMALAAIPADGQAQDVDGASDHPLLTRFEGARIAAYEASDFDAVTLPAGPVANDDTPEETLALEGRITRLAYHIPEAKTPLEVARNYEQALEDGGFEIVFACGGAECGTGFGRHVIQTGGVFRRGFDRAVFNDRSRAVLAARETDEETVHILLYIMEDRANSRTLIRQIVVESEAMATGQVAVRDAEALRSALETDGRVTVEGVFFETDSAEIRPESAEALAEMAALLDGAPEISVFIVGHTDNQGDFAYNQGLSERRAGSVAAALASGHGIEAGRMRAMGVANLAPIASNASEAGRERNRRVELVLQ